MAPPLPFRPQLPRFQCSRAQYPAAVEHTPAMDSPEPSSAIPHHAQPPSLPQPAPAQLPTAMEPALAAIKEPAQVASPVPQQPAVPAKPLAAQSSSCEVSKDKVVSTGCLGIFSCFKAGRDGKRGIFGRRKQRART